MEEVFTISIVIPGTLAANITTIFKVPFDCQLTHISAVATNNSDATLIVGTTSDTNAYIEEAVIGDSSVPVEFGRAEFVGDQYPHITDGTIVAVTLDFDGAAGTAAANVTIVLTFTKG